MNKKNLFILTGAPGVGKTTLIKVLKEKGIKCIDEPARKILAEQKKVQGTRTPQFNYELFCDLLLSRAISHYESQKETDETVIFDRGVADNFAYARLFDIDTKRFEEAAKVYQGNKKVFMLPPWKNIYKTDEERKISFEDTVVFQSYLIEIYNKIGCELIEVPKTSIEERVCFLLNHLK